VIAGAAQSKNGKVAARMLVAMEALEATFESNGSTTRAAVQTEILIRRTNSVLRVLGIGSVKCP
jgi:hypothetical protein